MKKGVGSVWNQGSWHWEEKNYNKWAKEHLKAVLETVKVEDQGFAIEISKCIALDGEASINIRKQKQIYLFNFSGTLSWRAKPIMNPDEILATGDLVLQEFNQDDFQEIEFELKVTKRHPAIEQIKGIIKKSMPQAISEKILEFNKEYQKLGSKPEEEKKHEEEKKMFQAAVKGVPVEKTGPAMVPKESAPADASAWNANAYHWEEKAVSEWAAKRLRELLTGCTFETEGYKGGLTELKSITGDASVNIRKAKKIVEYDYTISATWKMEKDSDCLEGTLDITMESVSGKEPTVGTKISKSTTLEEPIKSEIAAKTKAAIAQFVQELNSK